MYCYGALLSSTMNTGREIMRADADLLVSFVLCESVCVCRKKTAHIYIWQLLCETPTETEKERETEMLSNFLPDCRLETGAARDHKPALL